MSGAMNDQLRRLRPGAPPENKSSAQTQRRWRYRFLDGLLLWLVRLYAALWQRWSPSGPVPFPAKGPALIVVNHTCSADAMFLQAGCPRIISVLCSSEHYHLHPLSRKLLDYAGCVAVRRRGLDVPAVRAALRRLAEGRILLVFPEGNLSGAARGRMIPWKHGAAYLALRSGAPVYPACISGGPQTHRLLRAWLGRSGRSVRVRFGQRVDLSAYQGSSLHRQTLEEVTTLLVQRVRDLQSRSR
jgi:1-acyl-sn-glycerol-3-phosphate acyltransferase